MKKYKIIIVMTLLSELCVAGISAIDENDFQTEINDDGSVTIVGYTGWGKNIDIPAKIDGKAVTAIGRDAFKDCDLTGVVIPDGVTFIEFQAFAGNKLVKLTIGKGVNVNSSVFFGNSLTEITIGDDCIINNNTGINDFICYSYMCNNRKAGVYTLDSKWGKSWSNYKDWGMQRLKGWKWQDLIKESENFIYIETPYGLAVIDYTGDSKRLDIPGKLDNKTVKYIAGLRDKGLTGVRIPNTVVGIGNSAFADNQLTNVTIPGGITYIEAHAFAQNKLISVVIPGGVLNIGNNAFARNELANITIPNSVIYIGESAFESNNLSSITIPNSVTYIGHNAFSGNRLTSVTIPSNVVLFYSTFDGNFYDALENNGYKSGTYTGDGLNWKYNEE
jgi:hypothetical protein